MHRRWLLPIAVLILAVLSITTLRSVASQLVAPQLVFFALGGILFYVTSRVPFNLWIRLSPVLYLALNTLLIVVLVLGTVTRGSARWISVGGFFNVQPSQLAIPFTSLFLLWWWQKRKPENILNYLISLTIVLIPIALIFVEPDLGTTLVTLVALGSIIFFITTKWQYLVATALIGIVIAIFGWLFLLEPYQKQRVYSFVAGTEVKSDASYNAQQSLIAVGSGQLLGRGLGQGSQSHLRFLPERQTDFIFASLAEELGFLGAAGVISLYGAMISFMYYVAYQAKDELDRYFIFAIAVWMLLHVFVNIGMNTGLIPITGLTLPLLSYGGSSILSKLLSLGIVQSIIRRQTKQSPLSIQ